MKEKSIHERIKLIRQNQMMNQTTFAKRIGISQAALSNIEKGQSNPAIETLISINKRFGISIDWILLGTEPEFNFKNGTLQIPSRDDNTCANEEVNKILYLLDDLNEEGRRELIEIIKRILLFRG